MSISADRKISIEYTLRLEDETLVDTNVGQEPLTYVHGSHQIIPGLENAMEGMKVGEEKKVVVQPEEAYGVIDPEAFIEVAKNQIPEEALWVGAQLQGRTQDGAPISSRVSEVKENTVVLDFNHPLAGKVLYFDVKVLDVENPD